MTIDELLQDLQHLSAAGHGKAEIRIAHQPGYPHQCKVHSIKLVDLKAEPIEEIVEFLNHAIPGEDDEAVIEAKKQLEKLRIEDSHVLYVTEGTYVGYASKDLWDEDN